MTTDVSLNQSFITYLQDELVVFETKFVGSLRGDDARGDKFKRMLQQRVRRIEAILYDKQVQSQALVDIHEKMLRVDRMFRQLTIAEPSDRLQECRDDLRRIRNRVCLKSQPILAARLELAIRTLLGDLQLVGQILLQGEVSADITSEMTTTKITQPSMPSDDLQLEQDILSVRQKLSEIAMGLNADPLHRVRRDPGETHDADRLEQISTMLNIESSRLSQYLSSATSVDRSNFPMNAHLKFLPIDISGRVMEQPRCLVNEGDIPVSNEIKFLRLPIDSDRFRISDDKRQVCITDQHAVPISEPITFADASNDAVEFQYVDNHRRIEMVEAATRRPLIGPVELAVKSVPFEQIPSVIQPAGRPCLVIDRLTFSASSRSSSIRARQQRASPFETCRISRSITLNTESVRPGSGHLSDR